MYLGIFTKMFCMVTNDYKNSMISIFLLVMNTICHQSIVAQEITCIEHIETFQNADITGISLPIQSKADRLGYLIPN